VCHAYDGMPVTREFRLFVDGERVTHAQPYWPEQAVADGRPNRNYGAWRRGLALASKATRHERDLLATLASRAGSALGGAWSVDLLQDADGKWWLTDCAVAETSYRYEPPAPLRWPGSELEAA
jgi:hypothetical protein